MMVALLVFLGGKFVFDGVGSNIEATAVQAPVKEIKIEYAKDDAIEKEVADKLLAEGQEIISMSKSEENVQVSNNLQKEYQVETVDIRGASQNTIEKIADHVYRVKVVMKDTQAPIIDGSDVTIAKDAKFDINAVKIHAYDKVDGDIAYTVVENKVDTTKAGDYTIVVEATDINGLKTRKTFKVTVEDTSQEPQGTYPIGNNGYQGQGGGQQPSGNTPSGNSYPTGPAYTALDRNNLSVRGWKIIANDARVSDATIRSYMNELQNLPPMYNTSLFQTVYIDMTLQYPYLGMAYGDGHMVLNGSAYYATTILHEATHQYDFKRGFNHDPRLVQARNAELHNLPAKFSGNIYDDTYEWVANIVVYYYYDPATLRTRAPQSYAFVRDVILR